MTPAEASTFMWSSVAGPVAVFVMALGVGLLGLALLREISR